MQTERKLKTVQLSYTIARHDLDTKLRQARAFLEKGCRVRFEMLLKGRANVHSDIALAKMQEAIATLMSAKTVVERTPLLDGKRIIAQLVEKIA